MILRTISPSLPWLVRSACGNRREADVPIFCEGWQADLESLEARLGSGRRHLEACRLLALKEARLTYPPGSLSVSRYSNGGVMFASLMFAVGLVAQSQAAPQLGFPIDAGTCTATYSTMVKIKDQLPAQGNLRSVNFAARDRVTRPQMTPEIENVFGVREMFVARFARAWLAGNAESGELLEAYVEACDRQYRQNPMTDFGFPSVQW